jgi:hypothetical protein
MTDPRHDEALALIVALEGEVMRQENAAARAGDLERTIVQLRDDVAFQTRRADHAEFEAVELRGQLAGVLGSLSWRATRPLRILRGSRRPER